MEAADSSETFLATNEYTSIQLKGCNTNPVTFYVHFIHALSSRHILLVCKSLSVQGHKWRPILFYNKSCLEDQIRKH